MKLPTIRVLSTRYPDLAGVLMRDWQRHGCLIAYHYCRERGFRLVAVRPPWRWVIRLVFGCWLGRWGWPASWRPVVWRRPGGGR